MKKIISIILLVLIFQATVQAQEGTEALQVKNAPKYNNDFKIDPLAPATAAYYSAVLPGLGQAYNKRYWMIPVIYGAMGTSLYFYKRNDDKYNQVLNAFKLELAGKPHEFDNFDKSALERAIAGYKKDRDLSLFITIGFYILNIVEANVDAHLPNRKIDTNLSYQPTFRIDPVSNRMNYGMAIMYSFN